VTEQIYEQRAAAELRKHILAKPFWTDGGSSGSTRRRNTAAWCGGSIRLG
jgi:hypothetical protein